jgi:hypothetical protein
MDERYTRADLRKDLETEDLRVTSEGIIIYKIIGGRDRQETWYRIGHTFPPKELFKDREEDYDASVERITINFPGYDAMKRINGAVELYHALTQLNKVPIQITNLTKTKNGLNHAARLLAKRNLTGQAEKRRTLVQKLRGLRRLP